ncbi:MAG TPA: hypothetical protein PLJ47_15195, partial [Candidatus Hydrogenedentes bacterium]|nr:hypothetical protein [Candidatus Hydrogenedentota bacterium]
ATGWVCDQFIRDVFFTLPQVWILMTLVAAAHAMVFLTTGFGAGTGTAIFFATCLAASPGYTFLFGLVRSHLSLPSPLPPEYAVPDIGLGGLPIALLLLAFWFVVAYVGARHARSEVPEDPVGRVVRILQRVTYFDRERAEFRSPEEAQRWLEWRRGAYLLPWVALLIGILLTFSFRITAGQLENRFTISFYLLAVAPALVASLVGYTVTRAGSDYQWFVGARPLKTELIARARLRAGIKAIFWAYALLLVVFIVTFKWRYPAEPIVGSLVQDLQVITSTSGPYAQGLMLLSFMGVATVLGVWALFWLARISGFFVWMAGLAVAIWRFYAGGLYLIDPVTGTFTSPMSVFITTISIMMGIAGFIAIAVAVYRGYLGPLKTVCIALLWAGMLAGALSFESTLNFGGPPFVVACWVLLPFVPLASVPLALEWQRHR